MDAAITEQSENQKTQANQTFISKSEHELPNGEAIFHLGLTMAGAVTAGAYSGGVIDYLFEILALWEDIKNGKCTDPRFEKLAEEQKEEIYKNVPRHQVILDVIGGASAGGMTGSMAVVGQLYKKVNPVKVPPNGSSSSGNIFYDSWVLLNDKQNDSAFKQTLDISDLNDNHIQSILNSNFIEEICRRAFQVPDRNTTIEDAISSLPSYISKEMKLLLSHCLLYGVPLEVGLGNSNNNSFRPVHTSYEHFTLSRFEFNQQTKYIPLNPFDHSLNQIMQEAAIATGAFPIGLKFRKLNNDIYSKSYLHDILKFIIGPNISQLSPQFQALNFNLTTIDGGTVNNEPYGEVIKILENNCMNTQNEHYGMVMIDPFPDFTNNKEQKEIEDIFDSAPQTYITLREQSKVKRADFLNAYNNQQSNNKFGEIYPVKRIGNNKYKFDPNPICCASIDAFGGILELEFRKHDFFLGRNNSKNYFRFYFNFPYSNNNSQLHPIHQGWTDKAKEIFMGNIDHSDESYLPIIPDYNLLFDKLKGIPDEPFQYTINEKPKFDPEILIQHEEQIKLRVKTILEKVVSKYTLDGGTNKNQSINVNQIMKKIENPSLGKKIWSKLGPLALNYSYVLFFKNSFVNKVTHKIMRWILEDLDKRGFLK